MSGFASIDKEKIPPGTSSTVPSGNASTAGSHKPDPLLADPEERVPWREVGALATIGFAAVLAAFRHGDSPRSERPIPQYSGILPAPKLEEITSDEAKETLRRLPDLTATANDLITKSISALLKQESGTFHNWNMDSRLDPEVATLTNKLAGIIGIPEGTLLEFQISEYGAESDRKYWEGKIIEFKHADEVIGRIYTIATDPKLTPDGSRNDIQAEKTLTTYFHFHDHFRASKKIGDVVFRLDALEMVAASWDPRSITPTLYLGSKK